MKEALVIHPQLSIYAGAEFLCLYLCKILQESDYHVSLVSDAFDPLTVEELFGMGATLSRCNHIPLPSISTRTPFGLNAFNHLAYVLRLTRLGMDLRRGNFDVVFSTQSSIFKFPSHKLYHFVYEGADLFYYPMPLAKVSTRTGSLLKRAYFASLGVIFRTLSGSPAPSWFFCTGTWSLKSLRKKGFENCSFVYPPTRVLSMRLPKKDQIIQASRIVPEKRIEVLLAAAKRMPQYRFYLLGKTVSTKRNPIPSYSAQLLQRLPPNITFQETIITSHPDVLEESKVYFHTGMENGMLGILIEAMSAGCILVGPSDAVAGQFIRTVQMGYEYRSIEEAVEKLRMAIEGPNPWSPYEISARAKLVGPQSFEGVVKELLQKGMIRQPAFSLDANK